MTNPQIPSGWHPSTYTVDEHNKVVWKQGSHAVAMGLAGKKEILIPGYKVYLCTSAELPAVRHRIAVEQEQRDEEPFTPEEEEELGRMFADGWMRRRKPQGKEASNTPKPMKVFYAGWYSDLLKNLGRRAARNKALQFVGKVALFFAFSIASGCFFGAVQFLWLMPTVWLWETVSPLLGMAWGAGFVYLSHRLFNR